MKFNYTAKFFVGCLIIVLTSSIAFAQQTNTNISGQILTSDGKPASLVSVQIKELKKGTVTAEDGTYYFKNIKPGIYNLIVSFVELQPQLKTIEVTGSTPVVVNFLLQESASKLTEVMVTRTRGINERTASISKSFIKPMDLPQSVVTIGEVLIKDQQAQRLSDVIKNVNGVYLGTARASTQETFYARGYSFSNSNMFKNGSRVNTGVMPEMSSLESVEILKGSAAILFGNVAPGGILNMVTKKPKFEKGGEVSMRAGSYDLYKPAVDFYGPVTKNIAYRLNGTYESAGSFRDQVSSKRYYVNPSLLFKVNNKTDIIVEGDYLRHNFTPDFGIGSLNNTKIPDIARSTFLGTSWQYSKTNQATATASVHHKINDNWQLDATTSYQQYQRDYYAVERIQADSTGKWKRPLGRTDTKEKYFVSQVNINGKIKTGGVEHTLLTGIDADRYLTETYNYDIQGKVYDSINILNLSQYQQRTDIPAAKKINFVETPVIRFGAYVQDLISLSKKIKVLAGVRWSYQEAPAATTTYLLKDSVVKSKPRFDKAFSPRLGFVYKPVENISLFASYSNSFSVNTGTDIYNNALPPSLIDQYEIGIKNILLKGKLTANVTVYKIINNNLAQTARFDVNGNVNSNANLKEFTGQTTSDGFEVDLTAQPVKALSLLAGYSYNFMRYTKTPKSAGSYIQGERLVNTPAHTANVSFFYTFLNGRLSGFKLGAAAFYVGDRLGGWNNTLNQTQKYSRLIAVNGFTTVDVSAGYCFKKLSLMAKLSNIANTYNYYVHENYSINPIPPRQFIATVTYKL
jgi:iron complex outermembrane recepter protein